MMDYCSNITLTLIWFISFRNVLKWSRRSQYLSTHSPCPRPACAGRSACRRTTFVWRWSGHCTPSSRHRSWQSFEWRDSPLSKWHHLKLRLHYYLCFVSLIKMLQYIWNIARLNFLFSVINYKNCGSNIEKRVITSVGTNKIKDFLALPLFSFLYNK